MKHYIKYLLGETNVNAILIVDDQQGIRMLLNEVFRKDGYQTFLASNGMEAIDIFSKEKVDCVLLDMKIPGMDGLEILNHLKKIDERNVPVFMMTAYGEQDLMDEALQQGVEKFFTKPFNIFDVRNEINTLLGKV